MKKRAASDSCGQESTSASLARDFQGLVTTPVQEQGPFISKPMTFAVQHCHRIILSFFSQCLKVPAWKEWCDWMLHRQNPTNMGFERIMVCPNVCSPTKLDLPSKPDLLWEARMRSAHEPQEELGAFTAVVSADRPP